MRYLLVIILLLSCSKETIEPRYCFKCTLNVYYFLTGTAPPTIPSSTKEIDKCDYTESEIRQFESQFNSHTVSTVTSITEMTCIKI